MLRIVLQLLLFVLMVAPTLAEGWVVSRLRGTVEHQSRGSWVALERGMAILDGAAVRTGADGRVGLARGAETIDLDPSTQIVLHEGAGRITSIVQTSGVLVADVEKRNVQHFSVQTPFAAAVVKGTKFRVAVGRNSAQVVVERGTVQVQDTINDLVVDVVRGQQAEVGSSQPLEVSGPGAVAVFTFEGERVVNGTADVPADNRGEPVGGSADTGNGNNHGGGNGNGHSGNGNGGGNGNGNSGNGNGGGNGNGNSDNGNGGGNGNGNSGNGNGGGNGNGNSGNGNGGGNENGNSGSGNDGGNGNSNSGNGNGGGNGNGNGNDGGSGNGNYDNSDSGSGNGNDRNENSETGSGGENGNSGSGNGGGKK